MSRGPGRWQRKILNALEGESAVFLHDLLPKEYTRAQRVAVHRAARVLDKAGKVVAYIPCFQFGRSRAAVRRPEVAVEDPWSDDPLRLHGWPLEKLMQLMEADTPKC